MLCRRVQFDGVQKVCYSAFYLASADRCQRKNAKKGVHYGDGYTSEVLLER